MRAVVQRVSRARVTVEGEVTGKIAQGLLVLLGVGKEDAESDADYLANKIAALRVFDDQNGKINLGGGGCWRRGAGSLTIHALWKLS